MSLFQCTDVLANVQSNLTKAVTKKKKINRIFDRCKFVCSIPLYPPLFHIQGLRLAIFGAEYGYHSPPKIVRFFPLSQKKNPIKNSPRDHKRSLLICNNYYE